MIRAFPKLARTLAAVAAVALIAAACGDGDDGGAEPTGGPDATEPAAGPEGAVSSYIGEPESLVTLNANESEGIAVLRALYSMLVGYDTETTDPFNNVAESIDTEDNQTFTITLKDGWTFHNGEEVTAESFVNAWNYGAYGPNAQQNSGFFEPIQGFEDLQCGTVPETDPETGEETQVPDCESQPPSAQELTGLEVQDDLTFTVTLTEAQSFFPTRLGYPAYAPLPQAFFDDPEGFGEQPIGNGPFMMAEPWEHNVSILTEAYPDYAGEDPAQVGELEFRIYDDVNTAVNDLLAGNLDIVDAVPAERSGEVESQAANFGESPSSSINYIGFPTYVPEFANPDLRAALSNAVDREAIAETIFDGTRQPAYALVAPVIPGYEEHVCDDWEFDAERAQQLFEQAGGWEGTMTVWFNAGAAHETWIEAVTNMWRDTLGIQDFEFQSLPFAEYLELSDTQQLTGPFRLGWGMDYPHPQNYLQLLLQSDFVAPVGANATYYSSEEFDAKLAEALAEPDLDAAIPLYQEAQEIACNDTPLAPMFYGLNQFASSERVNDLYVDAFGDINYTGISVSE